MSLRIKSITMKNFLSVGEVTQSVNFEDRDLVLVLGENLDLGGDGSRNGVGKTVIMNALSYALYGGAITNIKLSNLINKTNGRDMLVTLEFEKGQDKYRIERGRGPNKFALYLNDQDIIDKHEADEAQGEGRLTQQEIERVVGLSHSMFKNIVALNTYNEPFLDMRSGDQREIIEQLLGITKMSEKAEVLKGRLRDTKSAIKEEQYRIAAVQEANKRIKGSIQALKAKSAKWESDRQVDLEAACEAADLLTHLDVDSELAAHESRREITTRNQERDRLNREISGCVRQEYSVSNHIQRLERDLSSNRANQCHTCGHDLDTDKQQEIMGDLEKQLAESRDHLSEIAAARQGFESELTAIGAESESLPDTFYDSVEEVYNHRSSLDSLQKEISSLENQSNPYQDQIQDLEQNSIQEVDYSDINDLTVLKDHQEFLHKLLTSKDSFIRKKIVDQNLSYLNARLKHYLDTLGLPHHVVFMNDLTVEITEHGRELSFGNLSRGEMNRVILSLSFAFRDVYESINSPINLLFIDEIIDNGLDTAGTEACIRLLKKMTRERGKSIWLISHKDELESRADAVMRVVKENGFTHYSPDLDR